MKKITRIIMPILLFAFFMVLHSEVTNGFWKFLFVCLAGASLGQMMIAIRKMKNKD